MTEIEFIVRTLGKHHEKYLKLAKSDIDKLKDVAYDFLKLTILPKIKEEENE